MPSHAPTLTPSCASSSEDIVISLPKEFLVHMRQGTKVAPMDVEELLVVVS
jgi:hypothetical protein